MLKKPKITQVGFDPEQEKGLLQDQLVFAAKSVK